MKFIDGGLAGVKYGLGFALAVDVVERAANHTLREWVITEVNHATHTPGGIKKSRFSEDILIRVG